MRIAVIGTDNTIRVGDTEEYGSEFLRAAVGGWIEAITLGKEATMFINEEGKLLGLPLNQIASVMFHIVHPNCQDDWIVGNVVIVGPVDVKGDETDLTMEGFTLITEAVGIAMVMNDLVAMKEDVDDRRN